MDSFYTTEELKNLGLKGYGENVKISRFSRFYSPEKIQIGSNVRIDDFCLFSGTIELGNYIHISAYCALYGRFGIVMEDYTGLSPRCTVFSASDDFSGEYLMGPMVDSKLTNVKGGKVLFKKYSQMGAGSIVMPGVTVNEGAVTGAMSLVTKNLESWGIYVGIPAQFMKMRKKIVNYF